MFNLDDITNEHNKEHNLKWPYIPDHSVNNRRFWIRKNKCIG